MAKAAKKTAKKAPKKTVKKTAAKKIAKKAPAKKTSPQTKLAKVSGKKALTKKSKGGGSAFMKPYALSEALAAVIGKDEAARTEITSGLWKYIKANNLQDPKNKRDILTDVKLKAVFGKPKVGMFEMTKLIGKHLK
jgi:upstream activation factor subunit UAF30